MAYFLELLILMQITHFKNCINRGVRDSFSLTLPSPPCRRIDKAIRLCATSISMAFTLTLSPVLTTSRGSLTKTQVKCDICTKPF